MFLWFSLDRRRRRNLSTRLFQTSAKALLQRTSSCRQCCQSALPTARFFRTTGWTTELQGHCPNPKIDISVQQILAPGAREIRSIRWTLSPFSERRPCASQAHSTNMGFLIGLGGVGARNGKPRCSSIEPHLCLQIPLIRACKLDLNAPERSICLAV